MAVIYVTSNNANVYPCAYRGVDGNNKYYDPESRMNSEKNITSNVIGLDNDNNLSDDGGSYVVSFESNILKFVFKGYRFTINLTGKLSPSGDSGSVYAYIKLVNQNVVAGSAGQSYNTRILGNVARNDSTLDVANNFEGVGFEVVPIGSTPTVPSGCESFVVLTYEKQSNNSYIYTPANICVLSANMVKFDEGHNITEKFQTERLTVTGDTTLNGTEVQGDLDVDGNGDFGGSLNVDSYVQIGETLEVGPQEDVGGNYCAAIGVDNVNNSNNALAVGDSNIVSANNAMTQGDGNVASGQNSHAEGHATIACNINSHAEGEETTAYGQNSHAEGSNTHSVVNLTGAANVTGYNYSNAGIPLKIGYILEYKGVYAKIVSFPSDGVVGVSQTLSSTALTNAIVTITRGIAYGHNSHSEGLFTSAIGNESHAEGNNTIASGMDSHAEGTNSVTSGISSHAEGYETTASGNYSHAEGFRTIAQGTYQHVSGKYNVANSDYAEIVGNGSSNSNRSNARTLDWSGNESLAGDLGVAGALSVSGNTTMTGRLEINDSTSSSGSTTGALKVVGGIRAKDAFFSNRCTFNGGLDIQNASLGIYNNLNIKKTFSNLNLNGSVDFPGSIGLYYLSIDYEHSTNQFTDVRHYPIGVVRVHWYYEQLSNPYRIESQSSVFTVFDSSGSRLTLVIQKTDMLDNPVAVLYKDDTLVTSSGYSLKYIRIGDDFSSN